MSADLSALELVLTADPTLASIVRLSLTVPPIVPYLINAEQMLHPNADTPGA